MVVSWNYINCSSLVIFALEFHFLRAGGPNLKKKGKFLWSKMKTMCCSTLFPMLWYPHLLSVYFSTIFFTYILLWTTFTISQIIWYGSFKRFLKVDNWKHKAWYREPHQSFFTLVCLSFLQSSQLVYKINIQKTYIWSLSQIWQIYSIEKNIC